MNEFAMNNAPKTYSQLLRFGLIGVLNTTMNFIIFNLLIWLTGVSKGYLVVCFSVFVFIIVVIQSYILNKKWVFKDGDTSRTKQFTRFFMVSAVVGIINAFLMNFIVNIIGAPESVSAHLWANIALFITVVFSVIGNFTGYKLLVFRK